MKRLVANRTAGAFAALLAFALVCAAPPAQADLGLGASPLFRLDTRTFQAQDSPLFALDTRAATSVPEAAIGNRLLGCSPNPFNPAVRIQFQMAGPGPVTLAVYDARGQLVQTILDQVAFGLGTHTVLWQGHAHDGQAASSGVYFVRFGRGEKTSVRAVTLLK